MAEAPREGRTRRNLKREERREQILEAALEAFSRGGYHGTHVEHIVKEAGVARGTFYLHFKSKHEVFEALVDRVLAVFLDVRPEDEPEVLTSVGEAEEVLRQSYRVVLGAFYRHRKLVRLLFDEAIGLEKGFRDKLEVHYAEWHRRVQVTLEEFRDAGFARGDLDTEVTAWMVLGMVERVARTHLFEPPDGAEPDLDRLVEALVRFEMQGIQAE